MDLALACATIWLVLWLSYVLPSAALPSSHLVGCACAGKPVTFLPDCCGPEVHSQTLAARTHAQFHAEVDPPL
eukprot:6201039-Pleurochrysis_carterae.AAC.1